MMAESNATVSGPTVATLPASFGQERLWFLDQLEPGESVYNVPFVIEVSGKLDAGLLRESLHVIVERHEVLRTSFQRENDELIQVIRDDAAFIYEEIDLESAPDRQRRAEDRAQSFARRVFDLHRGPLFGVLLIRLAPTEHWLVLNVHHAVFDGWSLGVLLEELDAVYSGLRTGVPASLPPLELQYGDFAVWQKEALESGAFDEQLAHWKRHLAELPPPLELPVDKAAPTKRTSAGAEKFFELPAKLMAAVEAFATRESVTVYTVLATAFAALLGRYSGSERFIIGTPVATRGRVELERIIGFLVNTVPLVASLGGSPTVRQALRAMQEETFSALSNGDYPFDKLVEKLQPDRLEARNPLFRTMFAYSPRPKELLKLASARIHPRMIGTGVAKFDLMLEIEETESGSRGCWSYSTELFEEATAGRMVHHYCNLLEAMIATPTALLAMVPMLSQTELQQQLVEWNDTARPYPEDASIASLFEMQVSFTPDHVAIIDGAERVTYAQLDDLAKSRAATLAAISPGDLVGIPAVRSIPFIAAVLGVLKAGGAYVPISPDDPPARRAKLAAQCAAVLDLDEAGPVDGLGGTIPELRKAQGGDPAYVLFTSGSTGEPKGVVVPHRAIARLVMNSDYVAFRSDEVVAFASNLCFDATTFELWGALLNGGTLVVTPGEVLLSPTALSEHLARFEVTTLFLTTTLFHQLVDQRPGMFAGLRNLVFGGEAADASRVRAVIEHGKPERLVNGYGPTETTTFAVCHVCDQIGSRVPIGRPIANTTAYILDHRMQPVPIGVTGELFIGGPGVAIGYHQSPELTRERFVESEYGRLYRTGDLARWCTTGLIEYLGRQDQQIKLRGYRIEHGEIEAVLRRHSNVSEAVVVARSTPGGDGKLVAYYSARGSTDPTEPMLRDFVSDALPPYMVPTAFVHVPEFPKTQSGKIDLKALSAFAVNPRESNSFDPPETPIQAELVALWEELLERKPIGISDNFFDLGGHSLLAVRLLGGVAQHWSVRVTITQLFNAPTVRDLSRLIAAGEHLSAPVHGLATITIAKRQRRAAPGASVSGPTVATLPASFGQERLWFLDQVEPGEPVYNVPFVIEVSGELNAGLLRESLRVIVERHEVLRTSFERENDELIQVIRDDPQFIYEEDDLESAPDQQRRAEARARSFARRVFDLSRGPLFGALLIRLAPTEHRLVLNVHHAVFDGWSLGVLLEELDALYSGFCTGIPASLPPLKIQYGDFAVWQKEAFESGVFDEQLAHWKRHLAELPPPLELPVDRAAPIKRTSAGAEKVFEFSAKLMAAVEAFATRESVTVYTVLATAFAALLSRYSGSERFIIGTPVATRGRAELERAIGFLVNTVPLVASLGGSPTVRQALRAMQEETFSALSNGDYPFEKLVEELQPDRLEARNPLLRTMFAYSSRPKERRKLGSTRIYPRMIGTEGAKFDLMLEIEQTESGACGGWSYSTELFEEATAGRLVHHYCNLLEAMIATPAALLATLPMLSQTELQQQLVEWNDTERPYPADVSIAVLFEERVSCAPDHVAIIDGAQRVTYAQLDDLANSRAATLGAISPGALVGIPAVRGISFIGAVLGVLKAGGAYVPISPDDPPARRAKVAAECAVVLDLAEPPPAASLGGTIPEPRKAQGGDPAYVLFTSGSTGEPKGVVVSHRAIARLVVNSDYVDFRSDEVVAFASNLCFDATTFELWGALLNGGTLVVTPGEALLSPTALSDHLARYGVTTLFLTTSLFHQLVDHAPGMFAGLRNLVFGGEAADASRVRAVIEHGKPERLVNGYGPTETTTFAVCHVCDDIGSRVPIGRPIANTTAYILDRRMQPVPIGVTGELYLGGPGLAIGYHKSPELTRERFVESEHGRLYRTGDLAKWGGTGLIEYLGRQDDQVKLRGFRVEPGEIEAALRAISGIGRCAVVPRDLPSGRHLVAYFTANGTEPPPVPMLRGRLLELLPAWMLPSSFVRVEALPLTKNGKLDVRALPLPEQSAAVDANRGDTTVHAQLAELWEQVLNVDRVTIEQDFFELGGHSLLAAKMLGEVERRIGRRVPFAVLFEKPTIKHLAAYLVSEQRRSSIDSALVRVQPRGDKTPLFFLHGDFSGGGFYCRSLARYIGGDRPFFALHPHGLHGELPPSTIEAMATERLKEVLQVQGSGPYILGGFCNGAIVAFEMARQLESMGEEVHAVIMFGADGSNFRYRHVERLARFASAALGESEDYRAARFLRWRKFAKSLEAWGQSQVLRIRAATRDASHVPRRAVELIRNWSRSTGLTSKSQVACGPPVLPESVEQAYLDALAAYVPGPLSAKVVLLWPIEDRLPPGLSPSYGWTSVCEDVYEVLVPGEHHTSIALDQNIRVVGERVRTALDAADRER